MDENKLIKLIRTITTKQTAIEMDELDLCEKFGPVDYKSYVKGDMSLQDKESFVSHREQCPVCQKAVAELHIQKEKQENIVLHSRTLRLLDSLDGKENLLDIVIRASRRFFELLSTSGEFFPVPESASARGGAHELEDNRLIIIKEFDNPPLSVQVVIEKKDESLKITLTVSLYDPIKEDFIPGQFVTLSGPEGEESSISDVTGQVFFNLQQEGFYQFTIGDKEKPDAQLGLQVVSE